MQVFDHILIEQRGKTALVTINKPASLNALDQAILHDLGEALSYLKDHAEVRGIVLTGAGDKAFVAGADIKAFVGMDVDAAMANAKSGHQLMDQIATFPKPIVAAVHGFALGGGLELAMACHIRIAGENARMGLPEVSLGIIPGYGGTQRLPQLVGRGKALEMILTGEMIDAQDALRWGLVNYVVAQEDLLSKSLDLLDKMYTRSPMALSRAIQAIHIGLADLTAGMAEEIRLFGESFGTADCEEGVKAFLERRQPNF